VITPDAGPRHADAVAVVSRRTLPSAGTVLLIAGAIVFAVMMACYCTFIMTHPMERWLAPVDLHVYRLGARLSRRSRQPTIRGSRRRCMTGRALG
jgi:hypothetical protein